nr:hypothetical protein [uncultured Desulfobulbus sp.]
MGHNAGIRIATIAAGSANMSVSTLVPVGRGCSGAGAGSVKKTIGRGVTAISPRRTCSVGRTTRASCRCGLSREVLGSCVGLSGSCIRARIAALTAINGCPVVIVSTTAPRGSVSDCNLLVACG